MTATASSPLMPKGTALWLIQNTNLSFKQIAGFCGLHLLEVQKLADEEHVHIASFDPIASGQLTMLEIERCEQDPKASLKISTVTDLVSKSRKKYVPVARRSDRPNAISWIVKNYPKIPDAAIIKLLATTAKMVQSIRDKTYWNYANLTPQNPVSLALCSDIELDLVIEKFRKDEDKEQIEEMA